MTNIDEEVMKSLKEEYLRDKVVNVPNFVEKDQADKLNKYLNEMKDSDWSVSIHPYQGGVYTFSNDDSSFINKGIENATQAMKRGDGLCYVFYRRDIHYTECPCPLCQFALFLCSKETLKFIENLIGSSITDSISIFASCYKEGCFLTTHTDTGRGKIAFVYNLTKDWKEEYGGQFELLHPNWSDRKKIVHPLINTLTIFNVEGEGVPHRVLPVINTKEKRLAIAGWFI